jgi:hypothetical protein
MFAKTLVAYDGSTEPTKSAVTQGGVDDRPSSEKCEYGEEY